jgi:hypothetical protein
MGRLKILMGGNVGEGRVHVVVGLAGQELERVLAGGGVARFQRGAEFGERINACSSEGFRVELDFAAWGEEGSFGERQKGAVARPRWELEANGAGGVQRLFGDAGEPWILAFGIGNTQGLGDEVFWGIAEAGF